MILISLCRRIISNMIKKMYFLISNVYYMDFQVNKNIFFLAIYLIVNRRRFALMKFWGLYAWCTFSQQLSTLWFPWSSEQSDIKIWRKRVFKIDQKLKLPSFVYGQETYPIFGSKSTEGERIWNKADGKWFGKKSA